jgi:hypothetical protein
MFAGLIFTLSFFAKESPRWLIKVGRHEEALKNLSQLRQLPGDHPYVQSEIIDINDQLNREREATMGTSWLGPIRELFSSKANLYRIQLSIMSQLLSQWSGANSITVSTNCIVISAPRRDKPVTLLTMFRFTHLNISP